MVVVIVLVIAMSGKVIYLHPNFSSAENQYHIPQVVVDICDDIRIDGREVMAAFPEELVQYVRQYDATICMPYGREVLVESWGWGDRTPLYYVLEGDQPVSVEWAVHYARQHKCHYLVIPVEDKLDGDYEDYGYEVFGTYGGYIVYKDPTQDFSLGQ